MNEFIHHFLRDIGKRKLGICPCCRRAVYDEEGHTVAGGEVYHLECFTIDPE